MDPDIYTVKGGLIGRVYMLGAVVFTLKCVDQHLIVLTRLWPCARGAGRFGPCTRGAARLGPCTRRIYGRARLAHGQKYVKYVYDMYTYKVATSD